MDMTLLYLCLAMALGLASTRLMKIVHLPNVTGYLIAGLIIGPIFHIVPEENLKGFSIITSVALGFIAFSIGAEFKLSSIKKIGKSVIVITFFQALTTVALVDVCLFLIGAPLPMVFALGAIATATAPAATLMVVRQYRAKGPVTDTLLPVVAFDDAIGLMVFSISMAIASALSDSSKAITFTAIVLEPLKEIGLSLVIGFAIGYLLSLLTLVFHSKANRIGLMLTAVFLGVALADLWNLSSLLTCMMIGAAMANVRKDAESIFEGADRWTPPLFMLFFVLSGADLDFSVLPSVGVIGITYLAARSVGKYMGAFAGAALVHANPNVKKYLGLTLLPQAGVAIGMAQIALTALPTYGPQINAIVLCATLVYELIGPVITKIALAKSGEIPKALPPLPQRSQS